MMAHRRNHMTSARHRATIAAFIVAGLAVAQAQGVNDWVSVGRDPGGAKYSPLTQITPANVSQLKVAWTYDFGTRTDFTVTPLAVNNVLYFPQGPNIVALKADTGTEVWKFDMRTVPEISANGATPSAGRSGISYWGGSAQMAPRIVIGVTSG